MGEEGQSRQEKLAAIAREGNLALLGMAAHIEGKASMILDMSGLAQKGGAVLSHVRIAAAPEAIHASRIPAGEGDLILGCDLVVASENARFSEIFARRGLSLDFGGSWVLPRRIGLHRAKELAFFGEIIGADEAERIGLVNRVLADGESVQLELWNGGKWGGRRDPGCLGAILRPRAVAQLVVEQRGGKYVITNFLYPAEYGAPGWDLQGFLKRASSRSAFWPRWALYEVMPIRSSRPAM